MRAISASDLVDDAHTSPLSILLDLSRISLLQNTTNFWYRTLDQPDSAEISWLPVKERDARSLLRSLAAAKAVDVEIDREGWRQARQSRPWYRRDLVVATGDVVALIVDIVDRATESSERLPGHEAKQQDDLAQLIRGAEAMSWALATRVDGAGALSLYIGSPVVVEQRVRRPHLG